MTKKEVRKAAKGCGFRKLKNNALDLVEAIQNLRFGRKLTSEDYLADIRASYVSLTETYQPATNTFISNCIIENKPLDPEEAYTQKKTKKAKA